MPRRPRQDFPGAIHHVSIRGLHESAIYSNDADRRVFLAMLGQTVRRHEWQLHAYCLMTTHYHLLVHTPQPTLADGMHDLNASYASRINRLRGRRGHVFAGRYSSTLVACDRHLLESCRYIPLNPVRAGMVARPEDWPWSSYRATAGLESGPSFFDPRLPQSLLDGDPATAARRYASFVAEAPDAPLPPELQLRTRTRGVI